MEYHYNVNLREHQTFFIISYAITSHTFIAEHLLGRLNLFAIILCRNSRKGVLCNKFPLIARSVVLQFIEVYTKRVRE